jgi:hypothetical protein
MVRTFTTPSPPPQRWPPCRADGHSGRDTLSPRARSLNGACSASARPCARACVWAASSCVHLCACDARTHRGVPAGELREIRRRGARAREADGAAPDGRCVIRPLAERACAAAAPHRACSGRRGSRGAFASASAERRLTSARDNVPATRRSAACARGCLGGLRVGRRSLLRSDGSAWRRRLHRVLCAACVVCSCSRW